MNSINENEVRLANLEAAAEMRRADLIAAKTPLAEGIKKVIEDAIAASGANGYAVATDEEGKLHDLEYINIEGALDGERLHDIDCRLRREYGEPLAEPLHFSFNTCCFGDIGVGDKVGIAYAILLAHLATHVEEIEDALNALPYWDEYNRACEVYSISRREAEEFKRKMKEDEKNAALAKVEKRLVVGAEIATAYERRYDCDKHQSFYTGVEKKVVEKVTNKLVFFKGEFRQRKKADVLAYLVKGLDLESHLYGWSFAEDIDMSQFPRPANH